MVKIWTRYEFSQGARNAGGGDNEGVFDFEVARCKLGSTDRYQCAQQVSSRYSFSQGAVVKFRWATCL